MVLSILSLFSRTILVKFLFLWAISYFILILFILKFWNQRKTWKLMERTILSILSFVVSFIFFFVSCSFGFELLPTAFFEKMEIQKKTIRC
jgi:uncharacterized membrane protein